jgi:hypothetical protein
MQNKLSSVVSMLIALVGALSFAASASASTNVFLFNGPQDPGSDGTLTIYRSGDPDAPDAGRWFSTGGSPDDTVGGATNGYLSLTYTNGHRAAVVFKDLDSGHPIKGFTLSMDVRVGAGSDSPADGFSVNFARTGDPVLDGGDGFAATPAGEENLPEEGTTTGLAVCFDAWQSGEGDVVGLTVRADNVIVTNIPMPVLNGACSDAKSIQTGPNDKGLAGLCWQPVVIEWTTNQMLNVSYKGSNLIKNLELPSFKPSAGRFILAGRTGGNYQEQDVDNLRIITIPR